MSNEKINATGVLAVVVRSVTRTLQQRQSYDGSCAVCCLLLSAALYILLFLLLCVVCIGVVMMFVLNLVSSLSFFICLEWI